MFDASTAASFNPYWSAHGRWSSPRPISAGSPPAVKLSRRAPMAGFGGFRPAAFQFLRDLSRNNEKAWFEANRDVYEREVRQPMRTLVETVDARLSSIAPEIVGDPKRSM